MVPSTLVCRLALLATALRGVGLFGMFGERLQGQTGMQNREALCLPLALLAVPVWHVLVSVPGGLASKAG